MVKLVILEGIDGAGKTTILNSLQQVLGGCDGIHLVGRDGERPGVECEDGFLRKLCSAVRDTSWCQQEYMPDPRIWWNLQKSWLMYFKHIVETQTAPNDTVVVGGWFYKFCAKYSHSSGSSAEALFLEFDNIWKPDHAILISREFSEDRCTRAFKPTETGIFSGMSDYGAYQSEVMRILATEVSKRNHSFLANTNDLDRTIRAVADIVNSYRAAPAETASLSTDTGQFGSRII